MKKKKILIVAHRWLPRYGGLQIFAYNLSKFLKSKGNEVTVITSKEKGYVNKIPRGIKLIEISASPFFYNKFSIPQPLFNPFKLFVNLKNEVKEADTIIINDRYYFSSIIASYYCKKFDKENVVFLHTSIQIYSGLKKYLYWINNLLGKYALKNATIVAALSSSVLEKVEEHYSLKFSRKYIINNFTSEIKSLNKQTSKKLKVLFVGRLTRSKGIDRIMDIADAVKENKNILFTIVGDGNQETTIKDTIKERELKNILLMGRINSRKMIEKIYASSDVFILIPRSPEGFSLSTCDALLYSLPIIISNEVPFEKIEKEGAGYIVDPSDVKSICQKIILLQENIKKRNLMSKNSKKYALKYLHPNENKDLLLKMIMGGENAK